MPKYLIVGKDGTLGTEFTKLLTNEEAYFCNRDELDITDEQAVKKKIYELQPEVIINCTAYNAVDKAEQEPQLANLINGEAVGYLAKAAESIGAIFVHYSTNYVFKGDNPQGYTEADLTNPQSIYGQSKLFGEQKSFENCSKAYVIRTAWLYGKSGHSKNSKVNFITRILQLAEKQDFIEGVSDQFGQPTWTKDLAEFTLKLLNDQKPFGIYHGTNSGSASWQSWAEEILKMKNINKEVRGKKAIEFQTIGSAPRPQYGILLNTKTTPMRPWEEALQDYLNEQ